jgi:hypothetical protein
MGFIGFWRGYFAARSAPLGQVPVEMVTALFYNFSAERSPRSPGRSSPAVICRR